MKGRVFKIASVLSLALCLATAGLWVRSYLYEDEWRWVSESPASATHPRQQTRWVVVSGWGRLWTERDTIWIPDERLALFNDQPGFQHSRSKQIGVGWKDDSPYDQWFRTRLSGAEVELEVPLCLVVVVGLLLPAICAITLIRSRRAKVRGLCARCNYNLAGNVSGRCPECGRAMIAR